MALFSRQTELIGKVVNLTEKTLYAYAFDGEIGVFSPSPIPQRLDSKTYYVIEPKEFFAKSAPSNFIYVSRSGVGRGGVVVSVFSLLENPKVRVLPTFKGD